MSSLLTTHVSLETPGCIISAVVTDDPVTKHQVISIHGVDLDWITSKHMNIGNFTFTGLNVLILSTAQLSVKHTPHCGSRYPWVKAPDNQAFTVLTKCKLNEKSSLNFTFTGININNKYYWAVSFDSTHKQQETTGFIISSVFTDGLLLKAPEHQYPQRHPDMYYTERNWSW